MPGTEPTNRSFFPVRGSRGVGKPGASSPHPTLEGEGMERQLASTLPCSACPALLGGRYREAQIGLGFRSVLACRCWISPPRQPSSTEHTQGQAGEQRIRPTCPPPWSAPWDRGPPAHTKVSKPLHTCCRPSVTSVSQSRRGKKAPGQEPQRTRKGRGQPLGNPR